jgi:hypothetical protein
MNASEELDRESESSEAFPHYAEATGEPRPSALKEGTLLKSNDIVLARSGGSPAESRRNLRHRRPHERSSNYLGLHFLIVLGV